jgi:hypothetical protein
MKKKSRSLSLSKESLRTLDASSLADAHGGSLPSNVPTFVETISGSAALGRGLTRRCVVSDLCQ